MINTNIIPPMVNPLGKGWRQPNPDNILIDDTHAVMSEEDLELLMDYSNSDPTGKYNGKMWKKRHWTNEGKVWALYWCHGENPLTREIFISCRTILTI